MKKLTRYTIAAVICTLTMVACTEKDPKQYHGDRFRVDISNFTVRDENGKMLFSDTTFTKMIFEDGDIIWVNGVNFELNYSNQEHQWIATRSDGNDEKIESDYYYCLYEPTNSYNGSARWQSSTNSYSLLPTCTKLRDDAVNQLNGDDESLQTVNTGNMVFAGATEDSILHLYPDFAILKFEYGLARAFDELIIGFDGNKVISSSVNIFPQANSCPTLGGTLAYLSGISRTYEEDPYFGDGYYVYKGDFLLAENTHVRDWFGSHPQDKYHLVVPLTPSGTTTNLYICMVRGTAKTYNKISNINLQPGNVYRIKLME